MDTPKDGFQDGFKGRSPRRPPRKPPQPPASDAGASPNPFLVRLDPNANPGEFNFVIEGPSANGRPPANAGLTAEASGGIPPQLYRAVDEVLGFIYGLDQQAGQRGLGKPRR